MNNFISKSRFITLGLAVVFLPFSIRFCHLSLLIFLVVCLFEGDFANKARVIVKNPLAWILPAFFLLHIVGALYSDNVANAWVNVDKKLVLILSPLVLVSARPFSRKEINGLMWSFVGACVVGSLMCLVNAMVASKTNVPLWNFGPPEPYLELHSDASNKWPYFSYIGLSSGIGIHPTYFALYLLACLLIVLRTITKRWLTIALVIYFLIFIVLLSSRIVIIATLLTMALAASKRKFLVAGLIVMLIVVVVNPLVLYRNTQEYTRKNFSLPPASFSDNPISIRMSLLWLSFQAMREINPIIGTGTGDVEDTIAALQEKYNVHNVLSTSDPHNQYLHTYIALGTVGLLALLAVFAAPFWVMFRQKEFLVCVGLAAFMVVCLTESAFELQKGIVLFALCVSIIGNQVREWRFTTQQLNYA